MFAIDAIIIIVGIFTSHNIVVTLLGVTAAFLMAIVIDKVFLGQSRAFIAHIISDKYQDISRDIIEKVDRTTTVVEARGGYTGKEYNMLIVTFTMNQYATIINIVNQNDRNAFVTIHPAHEISGEGFTR